MRELFHDLVSHFDMVADVDQWSGLARAKAFGLNGRTVIHTDFSEYFEVSYFSNAGKYLGGFVNSEEQDEMWSLMRLWRILMVGVENKNDKRYCQAFPS